MKIEAAQFVSSTRLGTRLVVRTRIEGGFTDAVGYLRSVDETERVITTFRALVSAAREKVS